MQIKDTYWKWLAVVAVATALSTANAGERTFDFDGDQDPLDAFTIATNNDGDEVWSQYTDYKGTGNPGDFLILTEAQGAKWTIAVFPDIDDGEQIKAFTLTADIRLGNGTTDRPADGFSISYAREADPLIQAVINDDELNQGLFGNPRVAEAGASTGVAISFDTWAGNQQQDGTPDLEGIYVHVDGVVTGEVALPTRHGECEDDTSLQTGPRTQNDDAVKEKYQKLGDWGGNPDVLCWAPLEVTLTETGLLTVKYKGRTVLDEFQTDFYPSPGRLVLAGRTGGANEIKHVDNIVLTTILADKPLLSGIEANTPNSFTVRLSDVSNSQVDQSSVALELDGESVTPTSVSKDGEITSATYTQSTLFESGSTHEVRITADTTDNDSVEFTVPFTVPNYTLLGAEHKLDGTFSERGFKMRVLQSQPNRSNYTSDREQHLAGLLTDAEGNPLENFVDYGEEYTPDAEGYIAIEEVINFDQAENGDPVAQGVFRDGGTDDIPATDVADGFIPGIPGTREGDTDDQITAEILTIVEIPEAGFYKFAFNSDDGFRTTTGQTSDILKAIELGVASQGRGATTTFYNVWFEEAGFYKLRSLWYEGGGGANLEWWTAEADGTPIALLNDDANGGLNCYRDNIPEDPASVVWFDPIRRGETQTTPNVLPMALGVAPNASITAVIRNGSTSVDADSVSLTLNGEAVTSEVDTSGDDTTVTYIPGLEDLYASNSINTVVLNFTHDGGTMETRSWTFTVAGEIYYSVLDCATGTALGSGSDRGINYFVHQNQDVGGVGNIQQTEDRLVSDVENWADPERGSVEVVNFQQHANETQGRFNAGNGFPDDPIPGLDTGDHNNIAAEFTAYLEFPEAGYYRMGVNSDDGFKVSNGEAGDRGPVNDALANALEDAYYNQGRGTGETAFDFVVPVAGIYPMRLLWWEGGGGADVEWYSIAPDGTRTLINAEGGIKAYRSRSNTTLECPLAVTSIRPGRQLTTRSATDVAPNAPIQAVIRNGITSLDADSVMLTLNGQSVTPEITTAGDETTVAYTPGMLLPSGSTNMVALSFTHGGGTAASGSWSFIVGDYSTLDCAMGMATGAGSDRGFNFVVHQGASGPMGNVQNAEDRLASDVTNGADPSSGTIDGVINFSATNHENRDEVTTEPQGNFRAPDFPDVLIPGIPGTEGNNGTDNIAAEFTAYLEFPEVGYYRMGVNSDDGFKVSLGGPGDRGPVDNALANALDGAFFNAGRGAADTIFGFAVPAAGVYPMRLIWYEGGGGANVEWFTVGSDGTKTLINAEGGLKAYRSLGANPTPLSCPGVGPVISASLNAEGNVVLTFTGTLHSSDSVTGMFEPVAGATSPYTVTVKADTVPPTPGQPPTPPAPQIPAAQFYIVR